MSLERKLKVIWTYRRFGVGGSETSALSVLPRLLQHFDITILLTSGIGLLVPQARDLGIPVVKTEMKGKLNRRKIVKGAQFIASLKPNIIHIHSFDNHFMVRIAAILAKVPVIITHHHTMPGSRYTPKLLQYETRLLPATDSCLFVSAAGYNQYWELVKEKCQPQLIERLHIIHDAFDVETLRASATPKDVESLRKQYSLSPETRIIGTVARIHPVKNLELLLKSVSILRERLPNLKCFIVGDGDKEYLEKIRCLSNELGITESVVFTGYQQNVSAYYKLFEATVLCSHLEGLPRCVIESYALGTPVVATRFPGISEILDDEKEGLLAEPDSPVDLANKIICLLSNSQLRNRLSENALKRSAQFTVQTYVEKLCDLYESLYTAPPPQAIKAKKKYRWRYFLTRKI